MTLLYQFQVWFKNRRAKCRQQASNQAAQEKCSTRAMRKRKSPVTLSSPNNETNNNNTSPTNNSSNNSTTTTPNPPLITHHVSSHLNSSSGNSNSPDTSHSPPTNGHVHGHHTHRDSPYRPPSNSSWNHSVNPSSHVYHHNGSTPSSGYGLWSTASLSPMGDIMSSQGKCDFSHSSFFLSLIRRMIRKAFVLGRITHVFKLFRSSQLHEQCKWDGNDNEWTPDINGTSRSLIMLQSKCLWTIFLLHKYGLLQLSSSQSNGTLS